jgi:hypothetical protein
MGFGGMLRLPLCTSCGCAAAAAAAAAGFANAMSFAPAGGACRQTGRCNTIRRTRVVAVVHGSCAVDAGACKRTQHGGTRHSRMHVTQQHSAGCAGCGANLIHAAVRHLTRVAEQLHVGSAELPSNALAYLP